MIKGAVTKALIDLLKPIQADYQSSSEWQETTKKAYPPEDVKKKEKKVKNLGTKFPGAKGGIEAKADGHIEGAEKDRVNLATGAEEAMDNLDIEAKGFA